MATQCPNCKKVYEPVLGERKTGKCIQDEFPKATPVEREQLLTGICSDECWDAWLGVDDYGIDKKEVPNVN